MRLQQFLNEGINDKGIFKAVFMAGHPGSGKSYVLKKVKVGQVEPRVVNTDKAFPLFKSKWMDEWPEIAERVKTITKDQLALYINSMLPLAIDGTSSNPNNMVKRVGLIESVGYDTAMVFVNTSLETALERASKRERQVDPKFIEEIYEQVKRLKSFYRTKFRTFIEIPNDEGELTEDVIMRGFKFMSSFYNGKLVNPLGKMRVEEMKENGWKYLSPHIMSMQEINSLVSVWYKK